MITHKWIPIQPIEAQVEQYDFSEINSLQTQWLSIKREREDSNPQAYRAFLERLGRSWSIETGIIEGLYSLDRGVTETLIEKGLVADYIERSSTDKDPDELIRMLRDHQDSIEFVYQHIKDGRPISLHFIRQLHISLARSQQTFQGVDQFGNTVIATLNKGEFKKLPNNPSRPSGSIHEYCPPLQVDSELENLLYLYEEYQKENCEYHALLTGAWLHHRFTQIHPFQDGNGRVARALLTWHLVKEGFLPTVISRDDRGKYIEALEAADQENLLPFVDLIVQLEKRTILQALGEPEPFAESGLVDQVVDHIVEQIKRQSRDKEDQLRSVNKSAEELRDAARQHLLEKSTEITGRLNAAGMSVEPMVDIGGPGEKEHWYRMEVIGTAKAARYWVNLNESRFFVKLSLNPDETRFPRLVFVISLHHMGNQLTGIMAATAFALIEHYPDDASGILQLTGAPYFRDCTVSPFTFTWGDDAEAIVPRFYTWTEECFSIALRHWQEFLA